MPRGFSIGEKAGFSMDVTEPQQGENGPNAESSRESPLEAEAVRGEIAELSKDGKNPQYEVLSGRLQSLSPDNTAVFEFQLADGTLIPADASGYLQTEQDKYPATVIAQHENTIFVQLTGAMEPNIRRGILVINDTALLERLAGVLEQMAAAKASVGPVAMSVFHVRKGIAREGKSKKRGSFGRV
jgi:hypothetical protein